jgi:glycine cleavage system H lipoate-binding protein
VISGPGGVRLRRAYLWVHGPARTTALPPTRRAGDIESTKSVSDVVAQVSGVVTATIADLDERRPTTRSSSGVDGGR